MESNDKALKTGDTITVDRLPDDISSGDPITFISTRTVVVRTASSLWIADRVDPTLEADVIYERDLR